MPNREPRDRSAVPPPARLVVLAPNWLGDAVMALPLVADLRRAWPDTHVTIAARRAVAPLYALVPAVDETIVLESGGGRSALRGMRADVSRLAAGGFDAALLLPNSLKSAWLAWRAGIPARWGFARDARRPLLTRAVPRVRNYAHQVEYYEALGAALGVPPGERFAALRVPPESRAAARALVQAAGAREAQPVVTLAPGAAYGRAKQWPPERYAELARVLAGDGAAVVLVGAGGDAPACREIAAASPAVDLSGRTDVPTLAALLAESSAVVSNDSGAMHLAAAAGAPVVAVFGPTDEHKTSPLRASAGAPLPRIVATDVWCRPCMLRECPIDHRCMTRISAADVLARVREVAGDSTGPAHAAGARLDASV